MTRKETEQKRMLNRGIIVDCDKVFEAIREVEEVEWFLPDWQQHGINPARIRDNEKGEFS